jgi:hypothetical protein
MKCQTKKQKTKLLYWPKWGNANNSRAELTWRLFWLTFWCNASKTLSGFSLANCLIFWCKQRVDLMRSIKQMNVMITLTLSWSSVSAFRFGTIAAVIAKAISASLIRVLEHSAHNCLCLCSRLRCLYKRWPRVFRIPKTSQMKFPTMYLHHQDFMHLMPIYTFFICCFKEWKILTRVHFPSGARTCHPSRDCTGRSRLPWRRKNVVWCCNHVSQSGRARRAFSGLYFQVIKLLIAVFSSNTRFFVVFFSLICMKLRNSFFNVYCIDLAIVLLLTNTNKTHSHSISRNASNSNKYFLSSSLHRLVFYSLISRTRPSRHLLHFMPNVPELMLTCTMFTSRFPQFHCLPSPPCQRWLLVFSSSHATGNSQRIISSAQQKLSSARTNQCTKSATQRRFFCLFFCRDLGDNFLFYNFYWFCVVFAEMMHQQSTLTLLHCLQAHRFVKKLQSRKHQMSRWYEWFFYYYLLSNVEIHGATKEIGRYGWRPQWWFGWWSHVSRQSTTFPVASQVWSKCKLNA